MLEENPESLPNRSIGTVRYNWSMSAHASQAFSIAHCTDLEDLPKTLCSMQCQSKAMIPRLPVDYKAPLTGSNTVILTVGDMYATDVLMLLLWRPNLQ